MLNTLITIIFTNPYIEYLFNTLASNNVPVMVYYKVESNKTERETITSYINKFKQMGTNTDQINFINCDAIRSI